MPEVLFSRRTHRKTTMCKMSWDNTFSQLAQQVINRKTTTFPAIGVWFLERSDAVKLLTLMFGLIAFMLYFMSGMFCYGHDDLACRIQAIGVLLFSPYSFLPLIFGGLILLVVVAVLLSVKPKTGSKAWEGERSQEQVTVNECYYCGQPIDRPRMFEGKALCKECYDEER